MKVVLCDSQEVTNNPLTIMNIHNSFMFSAFLIHENTKTMSLCVPEEFFTLSVTVSFKPIGSCNTQMMNISSVPPQAELVFYRFKTAVILCLSLPVKQAHCVLLPNVSVHPTCVVSPSLTCEATVF